MNRKWLVAVAMIAILAVLAGCQGAPSPTATQTQEPTSTPVPPTSTPSPTAPAPTATSTATQTPTPFPTATPPARPVDRFEQGRRLGRGVNLGNALEAPREGEWGIVLEEAFFRLIAEAGFDTVRVPIRWSAHA